MSNTQVIPGIFVEQVKQALEKLYDFQALQENALAHSLNPQQPAAHQLRRKLIEAIESLNPGADVAAHSGTVRIYNLIYMHYVGRLTIQQAAWEVGISLRQAYRDLRRGQELVSAVLYAEISATPQAPSISDELTRLGDNTSVTALQDMLDHAIRPVQVLADKYNVTIHLQTPADLVMLTTNHTIGQQVLTHILSQIIQQISPASLTIELLDDSDFIRMRYAVDSSVTLPVLPILRQMLEQINWALHTEVNAGIEELRLTAPQKSVLLLVIDDNEGLVHLLQRYLTNDVYTVVPVTNTEEGLIHIQQMQPDAIILDVMMPGMNGWELLQRLRTKTETQCIPVIICSVINDPELAFALGASQYLAKPVTRDALLMALRALRI